ncbi:MAG TPA: c-type cytochrome [Candidatus Sulfotelmatobacter sp.]|jgi:cytochrome c oxidase cbb3-type subunit 3
MNSPGATSLRSSLHWNAPLAALLLLSLATAQNPTPSTPAGSKIKPIEAPASQTYPSDLVQSGAALFRQDCSFCHGRDAGGGETGPDLTRSKLVTADMDGDKIGPVVRNGRPDKGMPPFDRSDQQIASLVAFIHTQQNNAIANAGRKGNGGRKGVDASDLQTGDAAAGQRYFNGAGGCANCHSPTGDLAGIAARYEGLQLEKQMLYPKHAKSRVTVTLASGETIDGTLAYLDEFTVGVIDASGVYRSWRTRDVRYKVDAPVEAHVELFSKYTDADVHNLMAYLQTLR